MSLTQRFYYKSDLTLIDPRFLFTYNHVIGFSVSLDALFQPPNPGFYQVILSINPPAA